MADATAELAKLTKMPQKPEWLFVEALKLTAQYDTAVTLHKTNMKEKPAEFANTPVVLTIEEVKTMMVDVMKD